MFRKWSVFEFSGTLIPFLQRERDKAMSKRKHKEGLCRDLAIAVLSTPKRKKCICAEIFQEVFEKRTEKDLRTTFLKVEI